MDVSGLAQSLMALEWGQGRYDCILGHPCRTRVLSMPRRTCQCLALMHGGVFLGFLVALLLTGIMQSQPGIGGFVLVLAALLPMPAAGTVRI